ncbi:MAG: S9 family peptidase [Alphaproteobacteria bacterium]|nr:S9 family peptidase [Alphaproteobacteria bacterium]
MSFTGTPDEFLDEILRLPRVVAESVSPDLARVAFSWANVGEAVDAWVTPVDGTTAPTRITDNADDSYVIGWTPDGAAVLVAEDRGGDERVRLYAVDVAPPHARRLLTDENPGYFLRGGRLTPDGRTLVYAANRDPDTAAEIEPFLVYAHDLAGGARRVIARPVRPGTGAPQLNEQGTHVLYTRKDRHPAGTQLWCVGLDGRDDREIVNAGDDAKVSGRWLADGTTALVLAETRTHKRVGLWRRADGDLRWVIDDPQRDIESAYPLKGHGGFVVVETVKAVSHAHLHEADGTKLPHFGGPPGTFMPLAPTSDGRWVGTFVNPHHPRDVVRLSKEFPTAALSLSRGWPRTQLRPVDFSAPESVAWRSTDGLEIQGWLYRAKAKPAKGLVVQIHGGPTAHAEARISPFVQFMTYSGFDVLEPNYRGSTGFGLAYREAIKKTYWGGLEQDDIRTGIEHLIREGIATPGRVGVTGTSYGGYSSWCAITRWPRETVAAAAPICGMTDLVVDYETTRPDLRPYSEEMLGGAPAQVPDRYRERSPVHFVANIKGALLIVQGERDPNVTPANVREVRAALDAAGIAHEMLAFADEGHGIARPKNQRVLYARLASFFAAAFASSAR